MAHAFKRRDRHGGSVGPGHAGAIPLAPAFDPLEPRALFSGFSWSAAEVYFSELINRARSDPQAEAARLGINLSSGLSIGDASVIGPKEPLALNAVLTQAARAHAADMAARNFFDHVNPDLKNPTQRAQALGYLGTAGENIGTQYSTIDALYQAWMTNPTQRKNILSLNQYFDGTYHYDHLGVGLADGVVGSSFSRYYAADFGNPALAVRGTTLLGVVFDDLDADGFYGIGEGQANVRIDVAAASSPGTVVATYTTDAAGNYQIGLGAGAYLVTYTLEGTPRVFSRSVVIGPHNVRIAVAASQLIGADDHADAGQWNQATPIAIDPETGDGASSGTIGWAGSLDADADLFVLIAGKSGPTTLSAVSAGAPLAVSIRLFSAQGLPLSGGIAAGNDSSIVFRLVSGRTYYVQVQSREAAGAGDYLVLAAGPGEEGGGGAGGGSPGSIVGAGGNAGAGFGPDGESTVAYLDSRGHPILAARASDGTWSASDLFAEAGGPVLRGDLATFVDPSNGRISIAGVSDAGLFLYQRSAGDSTWSIRNLSAEVVGARRIASSLAIQPDAHGRIHILARTADGSVADYWQNGESVAPGDARFRHTNIGASDLAPQGLELPALTGNFSAWTTRAGDLKAAVLDEAGNVLLLTRRRIDGAYRRWTFTDLSAITGAPALSGSLFGAFSTGRSTICGVDGAGNLWFLDQKRASGDWRARNITEGIGGPALSGAGVSGYANKMGAGFAIGIDALGAPVSYRFAYKGALLMARWSATGIGALHPGTPAIAGPTSAAFAWIASQGEGVVSIVGATGAGLAVRFSFVPSLGWSFETVSDQFMV